jgi:uncharacterized protein (DUF427 family)
MMKEPGADHPITIEPNPQRVRVMIGGVIVAETTRALTLREANLRPVHYIPQADLESDLFESSPTTSHCPYKGDASYWSAMAGGVTKRDVAWSYEQPYPAVAAIAGHVAFYPDRVDAIEELS